MSQQESWHGKLIPVKFEEGQSMDEWIQTRLGTTELKSYNENWISQLLDDCYKEYAYDSTTNILYKIEKEEFDYDNFVHMTGNPDGSYDFITSFYNGGTFLEEMLLEGIEECKESAED